MQLANFRPSTQGQHRRRSWAGNTYGSNALQAAPTPHEIADDITEFVWNLRRASVKPHERREPTHKITVMLCMCAIRAFSKKPQITCKAGRYCLITRSGLSGLIDAF